MPQGPECLFFPGGCIRYRYTVGRMKPEQIQGAQGQCECDDRGQELPPEG